MAYDHNEYMREYRHRTEVRDRINRYQRDYYDSHPELRATARKRAKEWYEAHREEVLKRRKVVASDKSRLAIVRAEWKQTATDRLGGKCARCGMADIRVLQFDHIYAGGKEAKRVHSTSKSTNSFYRMVALSPDVHDIFQLLCANCNHIKCIENGENLNRYLKKH